MTRTAPTPGRLPTSGPAVRLDAWWTGRLGAAPGLHVGYDLFAPWRTTRSRVSIVATGVSLEDALAGEPWTKALQEAIALAEHGRLPLDGQ